MPDMTDLHFYLAPMEGVTDSIYRQIYSRMFAPFDRYYMPFFSPTAEHVITARQQRELDPVRNEGLDAVPQILTNDPELFVWAANVLADMGYREVNLNLGCPSGTVVKKKKGSGLLGDPAMLDRLLDGIFSKVKIAVSVKTRVGIRSEDEFPALLEIFNRYPICELTVHPRVQADQYRGAVRIDAFELAMRESRAPVCYNGDLFSPEDIAEVRRRFPALRAVMLGRGAVANPGLIGFLKSGSWAALSQLREFHEALCGEYRKVMPGFRPTVSRMFEYWAFWGALFESPAKHIKRIRKAASFDDYDRAVQLLFDECAFIPDGEYCP